ncbi:MAG: hypothetical protein HN580_21410 [Deltaproteobacteria bacterium]|jgi:hypothetical protein|nr:hypothetical protein [Deltaproteobacteria bacterium]MBT4266256.1 hypothetical protein [Deltaproteobacteria bacterium]MBT4639967.1 hypothetical protein [Deltaproteobacteria bacterium]MBT6503799.1 hypothetical protein [Deltaproteobacteria bacterium]MBT6616460.1 hypothetical protein [Deltaproteobacteria bacterium]
MESKKKVIDLIYIEPQKDEATVVKSYNFSLEFWKTNLKLLQEQYFEQHYDSASPDVLEVLNMRKFLGKFLQNRLDWIVNRVENKVLRGKYLNVLPPFQQKGGIKTLLLHFYQMEASENGKSLLYQQKNDIEKEVAVLWDIYKLRKTIESINTIRRSLDHPDPFQSSISVEKRIQCLDGLKSVFHLLFQMCIKKEFQKELYKSLSAELVNSKAILKRREEGLSYVYPHVIKNFNYRNHFFYVYYFPGMKAKIGGKMKQFRYNYLDFEIIKQDFLIGWMNQKLQNNPQKTEIYKKYAIGSKTIDQIVAEDPSQEIKILQQLPINVFNDITAEINEAVSEDMKTAVDSFSENKGKFAEATEDFSKAQKMARFSLKKLKELVINPQKESVEQEEEEVPLPPEEPPPPEEEKVSLEVIKIKKNQIDFPYFQKETAAYKQKMSLLRIKMGVNFTDFTKTMSRFFANVSESTYIRRRTPKHEVTYPNLIKETRGETVTNHLLILGAEVKSKQLGMAYGAKTGQSAFNYSCFFVYGCDRDQPGMGDVVDTRNARGVEFKIFDFKLPEVQKAVHEFYQLVMENK